MLKSSINFIQHSRNGVVNGPMVYQLMIFPPSCHQSVCQLLHCLVSCRTVASVSPPSSGIIITVQRLLPITMPWLYFHVSDCNQTAQFGIHQQCFTRVVNYTSGLSSEKLQNSKLFRLFLVLLKHPLLKSRDVKAEFIRLMLLKRDYKLILIWKQNSLGIRKYVNGDFIKINQSKPE